jgi:hypothetical protein
VVIRYVLGTDGEQTRVVGDRAARHARAKGAVEGTGLQHAVAEASLVDGSDSAVALCGARVRVWRADPFPYPGASSDALDEVCLGLVSAALRAAEAEADDATTSPD